MYGNWFLTRDGKKRLGPFTFEQLYQLAATGQLAFSDMVLREGKRKWVKAGSIPGLFSPPVQTPVVPQVVPVDAEEPPAQDDGEAEQPDRIRAKTLWIAAAIVGILMLLPASIAVLVFTDVKTLATIGVGILVLLISVGGIGAIAWLIIDLIAGMYSCPECGKGWARVFIGEREIERKKCYGLVTRRAYSSSSGSVYGRGNHTDWISTSGSTRWQERVPVIRTVFLLTYECKFCGARWNREEVEEDEDFDIER